MLTLYLAIALLITIYQGYRGYRLQDTLGPAKIKFTPRAEQVIVLLIADAILYSACTAAGFISIWLAYEISGKLDAHTLQTLTTGTSVFLIFLFLFGLLGITGQLPHLIQQGKIIPRS